MAATEAPRRKHTRASGQRARGLGAGVQACAHPRSSRIGQEVEVELDDIKSAGEEDKDYLSARLGLQEEQLHLRGGRLKCLKVPELPPADTLYRHFST